MLPLKTYKQRIKKAHQSQKQQQGSLWLWRVQGARSQDVVHTVAWCWGLVIGRLQFWAGQLGVLVPWRVIQRANKVVSDSPALVDFVIGLVNPVLNLPDGQVKFFEEFK